MAAAHQRQKLCETIERWNESTLDMFAISCLDENMEYYGVIRFFLHEQQQSPSSFSSGSAATKCMRVSSSHTVAHVVDTLVAKFHADMRMLAPASAYSLWEVHDVCGGIVGDSVAAGVSGRAMDADERPLLVQLGWFCCVANDDDNERRKMLSNGRFVLRQQSSLDNNDDMATANGTMPKTATAAVPEFVRSVPRRFSKRRQAAETVGSVKSVGGGRKRAQLLQNKAHHLYDSVPPAALIGSTSAAPSGAHPPPPLQFARTLSNPELVLKRRREQKLDDRLRHMSSGGSLKIYGVELFPQRPYVTLLVNASDTAEQVVRATLDKYGLEEADTANYALAEVFLLESDAMSRSFSDLRSIEKQRERLLNGSERPLQLLEQYMNMNTTTASNNNSNVVFFLRCRPPATFQRPPPLMMNMMMMMMKQQQHSALGTSENGFMNNNTTSWSSTAVEQPELVPPLPPPHNQHHHRRNNKSRSSDMEEMRQHAILIAGGSSPARKTKSATAADACCEPEEAMLFPLLLPCLVPINAFASTANFGAGAVAIQPGVTEIGSSSACAIQLRAPSVLPRHCALRYLPSQYLQQQQQVEAVQQGGDESGTGQVQQQHQQHQEGQGIVTISLLDKSALVELDGASIHAEWPLQNGVQLRIGGVYCYRFFNSQHVMHKDYFPSSPSGPFYPNSPPTKTTTTAAAAVVHCDPQLHQHQNDELQLHHHHQQQQQSEAALIVQNIFSPSSSTVTVPPPASQSSYQQPNCFNASESTNEYVELYKGHQQNNSISDSTTPSFSAHERGVDQQQQQQQQQKMVSLINASSSAVHHQRKQNELQHNQRQNMLYQQHNGNNKNNNNGMPRRQSHQNFCAPIAQSPPYRHLSTSASFTTVLPVHQPTHYERQQQNSSPEAMLPMLVECLDPQCERLLFQAVFCGATTASSPSSSIVQQFGTFRLTPAFVLYAICRHRLTVCSNSNNMLFNEAAADGLAEFDGTIVEHEQQQHHRAHLLIGNIFAMFIDGCSRIMKTDQQSSRELLAFWLANASELLNMGRADACLTRVVGTALLHELSRVVQRLFTMLVDRCKQQLFTYGIQPLVQQLPSSSSSSNASSAPAATSLVAVLDECLRVVRWALLNPALTIQMFSQLFHFISTTLFNWLANDQQQQQHDAPRPLLCLHLGLQLKQQLLRPVQKWAEQQGLELAAECHMDRVCQTAHLLSTPKELDQIPVLGTTCYRLNSVQMRYLLENYVGNLRAGEPSAVSRELIEHLVALSRQQADHHDQQHHQLQAVTETAEDHQQQQTASQQPQLFECTTLQLPFLIPHDGYVVEKLRGIPPDMAAFVNALQQRGLARVFVQQPQRLRHSANTAGVEMLSWNVHMVQQHQQQLQPPPPPPCHAPSRRSVSTTPSSSSLLYCSAFTTPTKNVAATAGTAAGDGANAAAAATGVTMFPPVPTPPPHQNNNNNSCGGCGDGGVAATARGGGGRGDEPAAPIYAEIRRQHNNGHHLHQQQQKQQKQKQHVAPQPPNRCQSASMFAGISSQQKQHQISNKKNSSADQWHRQQWNERQIDAEGARQLVVERITLSRPNDNNGTTAGAGGGGGIGLSIVEVGTPEHGSGIYVKNIIEGSPADVDGRLAPGDQLLSVNGNSLIGVGQDLAAQKIVSAGPVVHFEVAKQAAQANGLGPYFQHTKQHCQQQQNGEHGNGQQSAMTTTTLSSSSSTRSSQPKQLTTNANGSAGVVPVPLSVHPVTMVHQQKQKQQRSLSASELLVNGKNRGADGDMPPDNGTATNNNNNNKHVLHHHSATAVVPSSSSPTATSASASFSTPLVRHAQQQSSSSAVSSASSSLSASRLPAHYRPSVNRPQVVVMQPARRPSAATSSPSPLGPYSNNSSGNNIASSASSSTPVSSPNSMMVVRDYGHLPLIGGTAAASSLSGSPPINSSTTNSTASSTTATLEDRENGNNNFNNTISYDGWENINNNNSSMNTAAEVAIKTGRSSAPLFGENQQQQQIRDVPAPPSATQLQQQSAKNFPKQKSSSSSSMGMMMMSSNATMMMRKAEEMERELDQLDSIVECAQQQADDDDDDYGDGRDHAAVAGSDRRFSAVDAASYHGKLPASMVAAAQQLERQSKSLAALSLLDTTDSVPPVNGNSSWTASTTTASSNSTNLLQIKRGAIGPTVAAGSNNNFKSRAPPPPPPPASATNSNASMMVELQHRNRQLQQQQQQQRQQQNGVEQAEGEKRPATVPQIEQQRRHQKQSPPAVPAKPAIRELFHPVVPVSTKKRVQFSIQNNENILLDGQSTDDAGDGTTVAMALKTAAGEEEEEEEQQQEEEPRVQIVGAHEVYMNDPRQRRLQELQANQQKKVQIRPVLDSSSLGFREKMRIFAEQLGEREPPVDAYNQHKSSSAERRIVQQQHHQKREHDEHDDRGGGAVTETEEAIGVKPKE